MNKLKGTPKYLPIVDKFEFLEYESARSSCSDNKKMDMGGNKLKSMLEMFVNIPNHRKLIFVADRDVEDIVKKFTENGQYKHHMVGNYDSNVYSFAIPVPPHRKEDDSICIEHYYTDSEIRTPKVINDLERHIFLGCDFNDSGFGQGPYEAFFCNTPGVCGTKNRIKIIDGSNNIRISKLNQKGEGDNYALSKNEFANAILCEEGDFSKISSESFSLIFDVLLEILTKESNK